MAILLLLGGLIVYCLTKERKWFAFSGLWFFVTLLPVMQIFPHHEMLAEHYLYIPISCFALFFALVFEKTAVLLLFSARSIARNNDWKDDLTLWTKTVQTAPDCAKARSNSGKALNNEGASINIAAVVMIPLYSKRIIAKTHHKGVSNAATKYPLKNRAPARWFMRR